MTFRDMTMPPRNAPLARRFVLSGKLEVQLREIRMHLGTHLARATGAGDPEEDVRPGEVDVQSETRDHGGIVRLISPTLTSPRLRRSIRR